MSSIILREATESDVPDIVELWKESIDFAADIDPYYSRAKDGHKVFEEFIAGHLLFDTAFVAVAVDGDIVAGYCLGVQRERPPMVNERDYGVIYDMGVNTKYRRRGIGRQLFEHVKSWFSSKGISHLELNVLIANETARQFWISLGFNPTIDLMTPKI